MFDEIIELIDKAEFTLEIVLDTISNIERELGGELFKRKEKEQKWENSKYTTNLRKREYRMRVNNRKEFIRNVNGFLRKLIITLEKRFEKHAL